MDMVQVHGLGALIVLVADIYAIVSIVQSSDTTARKVVWIVVIILLPVLGFIVWWLMGPRARRA